MTVCLETQYLGLSLDNPVVALAPPLSGKLDALRRIEDAGAGAVVVPSWGQESVGGRRGLHRYGDNLRRATEAVGIPIIASLSKSPTSPVAGWVDDAQTIAQSGAAAIELDVRDVATGYAQPGRTRRSAIDSRSISIAAALCASVDVPVSIRLTPDLSSIVHLADRLVGVGSAGLTLFDRRPRPGPPSAHTLDREPSCEMRLSLLWTAMLAGRTNQDCLATRIGAATSDDIARCILAGADVVMTHSAVMHHGNGALFSLQRGLQHWMEEYGFDTLCQMRGLMCCSREEQRSVATRVDPA